MTQPHAAAVPAGLAERMVTAVGSLVRAESPTSDVDACRSACVVAVHAFRDWHPVPARVVEHGGRPAWRWGPDRPRVLLLGHLDTVWPLGTLDRIPFAHVGDRLTGPGVFDMKAGVVQAWAALSIVDAVDGIGMLLTTDEEDGSPTSRDLVLDACAEADAVLVLEPSADGAVKTARKGTSWYGVDITGRAAHAGLDPERGVSALAAAAALVLACPTWADPEAGTTVTPTTLTSGTTPNTVPAAASLTIDVRAWTGVEQERVDALVRAWRPDHPDASVVVRGGINRPALEESMSAGLMAVAAQSAERLGLPRLRSCAVGGASDGNFTAAAGVPTLDGLGAVGDGAHADHEWASVDGMVDRARLLAGILDALGDGHAAR